jgi:hypothetical protein
MEQPLEGAIRVLAFQVRGNSRKTIVNWNPFA